MAEESKAFSQTVPGILTLVLALFEANESVRVPVVVEPADR